MAFLIWFISCSPQVKRDNACTQSPDMVGYDIRTKCLLTGRVVKYSGSALAGVKVTAIAGNGNPSACVYSASDGKWQLLLNVKGVPYTVRFEKTHYITVVRGGVDPSLSHTLDAVLRTPYDPSDTVVY